jgi:nitrate reductase NapAB chaperone NapD
MKRSLPLLNAPLAEADLVLGLVVLPAPGRVDEALAALCADPKLELGTLQGHRIPVVAECALREDEALMQRLRALPGVMAVEVTFAQVLSEDREA